MPITLWKYLTWRFLQKCSLFFVAIFCIFLLFDTLEAVRHSYNKHIPLSHVLEMSYIKSLRHLFQFSPSVLFLATITMYTRMIISCELVAMRALGLSIWQFSAPCVVVVLFFSIASLTIFSNIGPLLFKRLGALEKNHSEEDVKSVTIVDHGIWIKQEIDQSLMIIKIDNMQWNKGLLDNITIFVMDE